MGSVHFTPGVYVSDYSSSAVVLDFSETETVQMYKIAKNETDDIVSWFPCFEPERTFVAEKGKLTVKASTGDYEGQYSSTKVILPGKLTGTGDPSIEFVKRNDDYIAKLPKPNTLISGFYATRGSERDDNIVRSYAEITDNTIQIYKVTENEAGDVIAWNPVLGTRSGDETQGYTWTEQAATYTAVDGEQGIFSFTASKGTGEENKAYKIYGGKGGLATTSYFGNMENYTKAESFFDKLPNTIADGFYATQGFKEGDNIVRSYAEITDNTIQIYKVTENEAGDVIAWNPVLGTRTGVAPNYTWTEQAAAYTAVGGEQGVFSFNASIGSWKEDKDYKIYGGKEGLATVNPYDSTENYTKAESFFNKLPSTIADGFYATRGFEEDGNIVRSYAEIKNDTIQIYKVTESTAGEIIAWNPVLGTRTGVAPNYTWTEQTAAYTAVGGEQGVFSFNASIGSWKEDKDYKIYGGNGGFATVNPYDSTENYTKAESFFDKLPSTIANGFYVTSDRKNGDGIVSKDLAHFINDTVQVYFLQEKADGTIISVSSPALGTSQETKIYVPYTVEKGKIKFDSIYCRDDKNSKDYYGFIGLDTVSLPGAFVGSGDSFREFTKTDKDYTDYLPTEQ